MAGQNFAGDFGLRTIHTERRLERSVVCVKHLPLTDHMTCWMLVLELHYLSGTCCSFVCVFFPNYFTKVSKFIVFKFSNKFRLVPSFKIFMLRKFKNTFSWNGIIWCFFDALCTFSWKKCAMYVECSLFTQLFYWCRTIFIT